MKPTIRTILYMLPGLLLCLSLSLPALSQVIERSEMAELELEFSDVRTVTERPGRTRLLRADTLPGDRLQLELPFHPDRMTPLVPDGAPVAAAAAIASLSGPKLEHWLLRAQSVAERFDSAAARYRDNRALYEQRDLAAEKWQAIVDRYHALRLEQRHVQHVMSWLQPDPDMESATLRSPHAGRVLFVDRPGDHGRVVAEIIAPGSLRVTGMLYSGELAAAVALEIGTCRVPVLRSAGRVQGFARRLWSAAPLSCIAPDYGETLNGRPVFAFAGYAVPRGAVLRSGGQTRVIVERGAALELVAVEIAGEDEADYYLSAAQSLAGHRVLVRSASAVQGLLLGLGSD